MATRVLSVEVSRIGESKESDAAARTHLKSLCEQVQQATNYVWCEWLCWHHQNRSADIIRQWQADWIKYKQDGGEKPNLKLRAVPNELSNRLYHGVTERFPELYTHVVVLMLNRWNRTITKLKASAGSFSGWHAILLHRQSIPSCTKPLPLPFDTPKGDKSKNGNGKLRLPLSDSDSHVLTLKLAREAVAGKSVKTGVIFDCMIWDRGRQMASRRQTLKKIARGEYQMLGSQLCFSRGKIFAQLTYSIPDAAPVELTGTAIIQPGRRHPMLMRLAGQSRNRWICGDGRVVTEVRRQLLRQRLGRKSAYRQCPTSNSRGHGLHRAIGKVAKLTRRWRDFAKTFNGHMAAAIRAECQRYGIGTIVFARPKKDSRFLSNAGVEDWRDATSWDWFGFEKMLSDECNEFGIRVVFRGEKAAQADSDKGKVRKTRAAKQADSKPNMRVKSEG